MINATKIGVKGAVLFLLTFLLSYGTVYAQSNLFFSEYIEGSSNNKALEIYNPTNTVVVLDNYQIGQSSNGEGWEFYHTFPNGASIPAYGTYVITTDQVSSSLYNTDDADEALGFPSVTHHNGNDARAIIYISGTDTTFLDVLGDPNSDAKWAVGDTAEATGEHTLVRKSDITAGNETALGSFGTDDASSEWTVYGQNDFSGLGAHRMDTAPITIRDLNTYQGVTEFSVNAMNNHPLYDEPITFTAVITSYPRSSGNASIDTENGEDIPGRIHFFITDTTANTQGRAGMSIQVVEALSNDDNSSNDGPIVSEVQERTIGDVVTLTADLTTFRGTAQIDVEAISFIGNVNDESQPELAKYAALLEPWEVDLSEVNTFKDGELYMNFANYSKYNGAYIKMTGGTISNVGEGFPGRYDWAVNKDGSRIYMYDQSLRYRSDKSGYPASWNTRRAPDPDFEPPTPGAIADASGYLVYQGDDPDGIVPEGNGAFSFFPMEDGVLWLSGNRFVNGETYNGEVFEWPDDLVIQGLPPVISNVALSDSSVSPDQMITVTASAEAAEGTLQDVVLIYSVDGEADTLAMNNTSGTEYSVQLPGFSNFTSVAFYIEATDSNGLTGKAPLTGNYTFFVSEGALTSISVLQKTSDNDIGPSPLAGVGPLSVDITATVVSSAGESGFITIQDRAATWSGAFVDIDENTETLSIGDQISISELSVREDFDDVTFLELLNFETLTEANTQVDTMAVSLITQDITGSTMAQESYEGVLLTFDDVKVTSNQADAPSDFGEWEFGSSQGGDAAVDTLEAGEGLRVDDAFVSNYGSNLNEHVKVGISMESLTGILYYSFDNPKIILKSLEDVVADDWTLPDTGFDLETPGNEASVTVSGDVTVVWEATTDFDGNDVTYEWVLYSADSSTVITTVESDDNASASEVTLPYATVDDLLASAGLEVGESEDFVWNVRVSDGVDTVAVASGYDVASNTFEPLYYSITLERAMGTSNEVVTGLPESFDLKQNYPNPFNPTTKIAFDLPQAASVELAVFDMLGRKVATLVSERMTAGRHTMDFDASRLASGMYIYRIEAGSFTSIKKMMLIK